MYRRTLVLLWAGVGLFAVLAVIDAMVDFMGHLQGLFLAGGATCGVSIAITALGNRLLGATIVNRSKAEELRSDVDRLRCQMNELGGTVGEARDWAEAAALVKEARKNAVADAAAEQPEQDAVIYQFRLRDPDGHDIIVGKRTREPIDNTDELLRALEANDTGTLPGRFTAS